ncbi:MAG: hypothetical protein PHF74_01720 [Dehalococcoidales bacterium]|nr:hypothetical protein [Dehalococcoidales bacterium]
MASHYRRGQKVVIVPAKNQFTSARDSKLEPFAGRSGVISDYYWLDLPNGNNKQVFIYTIKMKDEDREVVVYEDEIRVFVD